MSKRDNLLLNRRSLETSPPQLRQPLAYVLHLRSYWKPEGRARLDIPASWKEFLSDSKYDIRCVADRCCLFRNVRFDGDTKTRPGGEELPREIVSQLLSNVGMDACLATCLPRAFEGIPRTKLRSNVPATRQDFSQTASWPVDFVLVPERGKGGAKDTPPGSNTICLLLGMKEPTQIQHMSFDSCSGSRTLVSIPEELASQGQIYLRFLASSIKGKVVGAESFPEWLVLFGLVYDARHVRIVAYVPHYRTWDVMECAAYIVDEVSLPALTGAAACELALEQLRLLLVLTTLRRHAYHLSKSLFATMDCGDGIGRPDNPFPCCSAHDQHDSDDFESLNQCLGSSQRRSPECSTCASSVRTRGSNILEYGKELFSSCGSFTSSACSTCLSSRESASMRGSLHMEDPKYTKSGYMEPSTISLSSGGNERALCPHKLNETKIREITAWARQIVPTEHPVRDTYRMAVYRPTDAVSR